MKNDTSKRWKCLAILSTLPMLFGAVGCDQGEDDVDALIDGEVSERWSGGRNVRLNILTSKASEWNEPFVDWVAAVEAVKECAGSNDLDALILTAGHEVPVGVKLGVFDDGNADPCTVSVPEGSALFGEVPVQIQITTPTEFGARSVLTRVENADACEGDGYFFEETDSGEFAQMSMCPSSCDTVRAADEAGAQIMIDVVLLEEH